MATFQLLSLKLMPTDNGQINGGKRRSSRTELMETFFYFAFFFVFCYCCCFLFSLLKFSAFVYFNVLNSECYLDFIANNCHKWC